MRASVSPRGARPVQAVSLGHGTYDLDPDNASILVCGGGGVALQVTRKLKNMGSWVWQLQRTDKRRAEIEKMMAICAKGDAMDVASLQKVFDSIEEVDAVVCTLGGGGDDDVSVNSVGTINVIEAAVKKGVKKFVLVTSIGCGETKDAVGPQVYASLEKVLIEKNKAEVALKASKMSYVIVRPGGLTNDASTGKATLTEDMAVCGSISREDTATLVIKALLNNSANNKTLSALDPTRPIMGGKPAPVVFTP
ncbi:hypothetical protein FOA52_013022 [Chlamydomonas sp. UWO 241]|nr:hypothetical protein FOA52_013022 [Chlamydomonas sp. UWO 241]